MARHLYLLCLPLFVQLVQPQFLNSTLACSETCQVEGETVATCNTDDFFCFCQSEIFHETYICCVRSLCDSTNAASLTDAAASRCAAVGAAFTAVSTSVCSTIFNNSRTTPATSTQGSSSSTGTISQSTIKTTSTATQQVSENSNSGNNSVSTTSSTAGPSSLFSSGNILSSGSSTGSGLSTGAKAGIGAGVGVGVLMILVVVIVISRRTRKRHREARDADQHQPPSPPPQDMPETSDHGDETTPWVEYKKELDARQNVHQLPAHGDQRMSGREHDTELDANQGHHRQQSGQNNDVAELAARNPPPAELAATLSRPWNELHADPVYYHQLPTGENTSELP